MNSIFMDCITWDMDKIIYTCNAEHIGFVFPKRKWWDLSKQPREVRMEFVETFSGEEVGVCARVLESGSSVGQRKKTAATAVEVGESLESKSLPGCHIRIPLAYRNEIWQEFILRSRKKKKYEALLIVDPDGSGFPDRLPANVEDVNYLAVLTAEPLEYEYVLDELEREYGLFGMVFTQYRDFAQYQRQVCAGNHVLVFMGDGGWSDETGKSTFFRFPKGSLVLDFGESSAYHKMIKGKRMENDYARLSVFLDNIIKNRYNSVVNEGLQIKKGQESHLQQNVSRTDDNNKLGEKRKGIRKWKKRRIS